MAKTKLDAKAVSQTVLTNSLDNESGRSTRYQLLDHWRGLACLFVVVCHATHVVCDARHHEQQPKVTSKAAAHSTEHLIFSGLPQIRKAGNNGDTRSSSHSNPDPMDSENPPNDSVKWTRPGIDFHEEMEEGPSLIPEEIPDSESDGPEIHRVSATDLSQTVTAANHATALHDLERLQTSEDPQLIQSRDSIAPALLTPFGDDETTRENEIAEPKTTRIPQRIARQLVWLTGQMRFGVEMFFVISGYCIAASAESLRRSGNTLREYFRRRFVRIFPTYWCALLFSVLCCLTFETISPGQLKRSPWALTMPWDLSISQAIGSMTLTGTWIGYITGAPASWNPLSSCFPLHSWTLCYEEQFYAVIGIVLAVSGRSFFRVAALLTATIAFVDVLAVVYNVPVRGFFFDEHWFMFAAGLGTYWSLNIATPRQSISFRFVLAAAIISLCTLATTTSLFGTGAHFSAWRVIGAWGFSILLLWLKKYDETIARLKCLQWLKSCGVMSYSIYLTHLFPGKVISQQLLCAGFNDDLSTLLICVPLVLATSISLGYLFHHVVERCFLKPNNGPTSRLTLVSLDPALGNTA